MKKHIKGVITFVLLVGMVLCLTVSYSEEYDFTEDPDAIEHAADSVFMLEVYNANNQQIAVGSGFVAFEEKLLISNYHVIEDAAYVVAVSDEYIKYIVQSVCAVNKEKDIVLLKFDENVDVEPLKIDSETPLKRSMKVVAIGSPAGLMNTISIGNISAFYKHGNKDWIQFTAPISSGSSGGPLFNKEGNVIGITTATYASAQNVNMAVKASDIMKLYNSWNHQIISIERANGKQNTITVASIDHTTDDYTTVYVTAYGSKYHRTPNCSKMKNPIGIDLIEAIEKGYEPCNKCFR